MLLVQRWHKLPPGLSEQHSAVREGLLLPRKYCADTVQFGHVLIRNKRNEFKHLHRLPCWIVVRLRFDSADAVPGGHVVDHAQRAGRKHVRVLPCRHLHAQRGRNYVHYVPPRDVLQHLRDDTPTLRPGHLQLQFWSRQPKRVPAVQRRNGFTCPWRYNERNMHSCTSGHVQWRGRKRVYPVPSGHVLGIRRLVLLGLRVVPHWDVLDGAWRDELAHMHCMPAGIVLPFCRHWRCSQVPAGHVSGQRVVNVVHVLRPWLLLQR